MKRQRLEHIVVMESFLGMVLPLSDRVGSPTAANTVRRTNTVQSHTVEKDLLEA